MQAVCTHGAGCRAGEIEDRKSEGAGGLQQGSSSATLDDERVGGLSLPSSVMPAKNAAASGDVLLRGLCG
jgi:hypothetical protein